MGFMFHQEKERTVSSSANAANNDQERASWMPTELARFLQCAFDNREHLDGIANEVGGGFIWIWEVSIFDVGALSFVRMTGVSKLHCRRSFCRWRSIVVPLFASCMCRRGNIMDRTSTNDSETTSRSQMRRCGFSVGKEDGARKFVTGSMALNISRQSCRGGNQRGFHSPPPFHIPHALPPTIGG